jgi:hypothetical protein
MEHVYAHTEWREGMIVDSKDAELHVSCLSPSLSQCISLISVMQGLAWMLQVKTHTSTHTRAHTHLCTHTHTHTCAQPDGCIYLGESHIEIYYKGTQVVVPTQILKKKKNVISATSLANEGVFTSNASKG